MMKNNVKLYGFDMCPYCEELRGLLDNEGIEYNYIDVEDEKNNDEFNKIISYAKTDSVPIIIVGKRILSPDISYKTINEAFELIKKFL